MWSKENSGMSQRLTTTRQIFSVGLLCSEMDYTHSPVEWMAWLLFSNELSVGRCFRFDETREAGGLTNR